MVQMEIAIWILVGVQIIFNVLCFIWLWALEQNVRVSIAQLNSVNETLTDILRKD